MKFSYIISIIILFSTSCNKEEDSTSDYHYDPTWSVESNYYFKGTIKDTSNNISLINCHYLANTCNYSKKDTIKDSTYFYHYRKIGSKYP